MQTHHIPLFVSLIKLLVVFNGQQQIKCGSTIVSTDTCHLRSLITTYPEGSLLRAITPSCAGKEGIDLIENIRTKLQFANSSFFNDIDADSFGMKFYMKPRDSCDVVYGGIKMVMEKNGIRLYYPFMKDGLPDFNTPYELEIPNANEEESNYCIVANGDHSDWIQLIGIKVKVPRRKKRVTPSGDQTNDSPWMMIGFDYDAQRYGLRPGHFNVYANGKIVHSRNISRTEHLLWSSQDKGQIEVSGRAKYSCIEYSDGVQDASYFQDFNLNACKEHYKGQPEKKFEDCQKHLHK